MNMNNKAVMNIEKCHPKRGTAAPANLPPPPPEFSWSTPAW